MMRYQRVSPDYNPLSNGSKSSFRCKDDVENGSKGILNNGGGFRFRSPSKPPPPPSQENNNDNNNHNNNNTTTSACSPVSDNNGSHGGDVLLQWGHKKRARLSRTEIRSLTDDSSSSSSIHRRGGGGFSFIDKLPPPSPHSQPSIATSASTRASNLRTKDSFGFINNRNLEDRPGAANGSPSRNLAGGNRRSIARSAASKESPAHISDHKKMRKEEKTTNRNGSMARTDAVSTTVESEQEAEAEAVLVAAAAATTTKNAAVLLMADEKVNVEVIEWPKIYIALSRKEKEDDFLAMKGTKLPQRPKKRAKNIDRTLQYCFPGMWLSDLTKSRYEVREKKCVKKQKRRGLKGMESIDSDSEQ